MAITTRELRAALHKIEALGYATVYLPDHFVDTQMAPMVGLAVAAEATRTLRVGALVFDNDYKHPAILAKEIATLDRLSDGRTEMGIGAGWMKVDYDALGLPYDQAGVRVDRLEEALAVIKGSWGPDPVQLRRNALHDHRLQRHPEADPTAAPADPRRRRRAAGPAPGRARGRHRRHQSEPAGRRGDPRCRVGLRRRDGRPEGGVDPRGRRGPLRRPRAADPVLLRRDHRRPPGARRSRGAGLRPHARSRDGVGDHVHRDDRRDLRPARSRGANAGA